MPVFGERTRELLNTIPLSCREDSSLPALEEWLGITENEGPSIEDQIPSQAFFESFCTMIVWACNLPVYSLQTEQDFDNVEIVRISRWFRHCIDLHFSPKKSFTQLLLACTKREELIAATYNHISRLSQLQAAQNAFIQNLRSNMGKDRAKEFSKIQHVSDRFQDKFDDHVASWESILSELYLVGDANIRSLSRKHLASYWNGFIRISGAGVSLSENTKASGVKMTLRLLLRILKGSPEIQSPHKHLLFQSLIPLHKPSSLVLWRDQTALLDLYHEPLVQCIAILLQKEPSWISPTIEALINPPIWTPSTTPKIILLLHEIGIFLKLLPPKSNPPDVWASLFSKLAFCMSSDNSRMSEHGLQFFRNESFQEFFLMDIDTCLPQLLKAVVKREIPWNPTVRKMTYNVLKDIYDKQPKAFAKACKFSGNNVSPPDRNVVESEKKEESDNSESKRASKTPDFSLKAGMGNWRPPKRNNTNMPPPTRRARKSPLPPQGKIGKGVAPWSKSGGGNAPPLTITGVAPWAMQNSKRKEDTETSQKNQPNVSGTNVLDGNDDHALTRILEYMEKIKPAAEEGGTSSWSKVQMEKTPTLLPSLKFHDLVFGNELGSGAFGTVKYARRIDRSTTRSRWAEYAVKIISTKKIKEMGYEASVQREIATLRLLSHPGIARLISSFRFRDGAYLVLEYASQGDLHTLLRNKGSLDHESAQFVIGEIVAALYYIHDLGFTYGDLKTENILITETGHIKLTDFGGCRAHSSSAKVLIASSAKNVLNQLRNGDYKDVKEEPRQVLERVTDWGGKTLQKDIAADEEVLQEDNRIEGTIAYLPPEVVLGAIPTPAADAWALGCVLYQCLTGRPPLLAMDDEATRKKIVKFETSSNHSDALFTQSHDRDLQDGAKKLIRKLMNPILNERITMFQTANDPFFDGNDVFSLFQKAAYPLDVGTNAPVADAKWSRRQLSSIWAPQPKAYDISPTTDSGAPETSHSLRTAPIPEGDERKSFFSFQPGQSSKVLQNVVES